MSQNILQQTSWDILEGIKAHVSDDEDYFTPSNQTSQKALYNNYYIQKRILHQDGDDHNAALKKLQNMIDSRLFNILDNYMEETRTNAIRSRLHQFNTSKNTFNRKTHRLKHHSLDSNSNSEYYYSYSYKNLLLSNKHVVIFKHKQTNFHYTLNE